MKTNHQTPSRAINGAIEGAITGDAHYQKDAEAKARDVGDGGQDLQRGLHELLHPWDVVEHEQHAQRAE